MRLGHLLTNCVAIGTVSLMIGTLAIAQKGAPKSEIGSCAAYSGLPLCFRGGMLKISKKP